MLSAMYLLANMKIGFKIKCMGKICVLQTLLWGILSDAP